MGKFGAGTMMAVIFATVLGLGGAYAVREYLNQPEVVEPEPQTPPRNERVLVALYDMPAGHVVGFNDIQVIELTPEAYKKSKFASQPRIAETARITGRMLKNPIRKGQVFAPDTFFRVGDGPGIPLEKLQGGFVATTLPISNLAALRGLLKPGAFVDVYYRSKKPEVTLPLLEKVEVLAVGTAVLPSQPMPKEAKTATIKVSKYQAQALSVVEGKGELTLTLRSPDDFNKRTGAGVRMTLGQLLGLPTGIRLKTLDIYNGGKKSTMVFDRKLVTDSRLHIQTPIPEDPPAVAKKKN